MHNRTEACCFNDCPGAALQHIPRRRRCCSSASPQPVGCKALRVHPPRRPLHMQILCAVSVSLLLLLLLLLLHGRAAGISKVKPMSLMTHN